MFHGTLALLNQTLRTDSRKLSAHLFMLLFVGLIFLMMLQASSWVGAFMSSAPGLSLFSSIAWLNFWFILVAGIGFFSSAITEEKEEDTLGLLKMTGLSPLVLLLGKSTSRLLFALLLLSVQIPFTLLAVTLGGVNIDQIFASYIALGSFTILVANVALFFSVLSRNTKSSAIATGLFYCLVYVFALTLYALTIYGYAFLWPVARFLYEESIVMRLYAILATGFTGEMITPQVWSNLLAGIFFFLMSWVMFERCTVSADSSPARTDLFRTRKSSRKYSGRAWQLALSWKDFHFQSGGVFVIIIKFLVYGLVILGMMWLTEGGWRYPKQDEVAAWFMFGSLFFMVLEVVFYAGSIFREEVRWQTLSVLVMLPYSVAQISYQKVFGYLWALIPAVCYFLLGAALAPELVIEFLEEVLLNEAIAFLAFMMTLMAFLTFIHLVAFMSLYIKWGAIPLSILISISVSFCYVFVFSMAMLQSTGSDGEGFVMLTLILLSVVCLVLHVLIGERIKTLASQ